MKDVYFYLESMKVHDVWKVNYAVVPRVRFYDRRYYNYLSIPSIIPTFYSDSVKLENYFTKDKYSAIIHVDQIDSAFVRINEDSVNVDKLSEHLYEIYKQDVDFVMMYQIDSNMAFGDYIKTKSASLKAIQKVRDDKSIMLFSRSYEDLKFENKMYLQEMYPHRFFEIGWGNRDK